MSMTMTRRGEMILLLPGARLWGHHLINVQTIQIMTLSLFLRTKRYLLPHLLHKKIISNLSYLAYQLINVQMVKIMTMFLFVRTKRYLLPHLLHKKAIHNLSYLAYLSHAVLSKMTLPKVPPCQQHKIQDHLLQIHWKNRYSPQLFLPLTNNILKQTNQTITSAMTASLTKLTLSIPWQKALLIFLTLQTMPFNNTTNAPPHPKPTPQQHQPNQCALPSPTQHSPP
mmetsp:Transcript_19129/g.28038  ORF Transcript_19129/g.28038 Transcript_19129/m.28038 type:complete len:226 (+) Transcript_19129:217-894(+)